MGKIMVPQRRWVLIPRIYKCYLVKEKGVGCGGGLGRYDLMKDLELARLSWTVQVEPNGIVSAPIREKQRDFIHTHRHRNRYTDTESHVKPEAELIVIQP